MRSCAADVCTRTGRTVEGRAPASCDSWLRTTAGRGRPAAPHRQSTSVVLGAGRVASGLRRSPVRGRAPPKCRWPEATGSREKAGKTRQKPAYLFSVRSYGRFSNDRWGVIHNVGGRGFAIGRAAWVRSSRRRAHSPSAQWLREGSTRAVSCDPEREPTPGTPGTRSKSSRGLTAPPWRQRP